MLAEYNGDRQMGKFKFENTEIEGLKTVTPFLVRDNRGYFSKNFEKDEFRQNGIDFDVYECLESFSFRGVIRGLHFQYKDSQAKLIRVIHGEIYDVAVDLRKDSITFGKWKGIYLSSENKKNFLIPRGFAHGFLTLSETAVVGYYADNRFAAEYDGGIAWNDPDLSVVWPVDRVHGNVTLSDKDRQLQSFKAFVQTVGFVE